MDLALARDRSPAAYREALSTIAQCVAELIDLTGDVALLAASGECSEESGRRSHVGAVFTALADRFGARRGSPVWLDPGTRDRHVAGDSTLIIGGLSLLVEHALKHRRRATRVQLRAVASEEDDGVWRTMDFVLEAVPGGFTPATWQALAGEPGAGLTAHGEMRLHTAARIIGGCGGSLTPTSAGGAECVLIRLRPAAPLSGAADELL